MGPGRVGAPEPARRALVTARRPRNGSTSAAAASAPGDRRSRRRAEPNTKTEGACQNRPATDPIAHAAHLPLRSAARRGLRADVRAGGARQRLRLPRVVRGQGSDRELLHDRLHGHGLRDRPGRGARGAVAPDRGLGRRRQPAHEPGHPADDRRRPGDGARPARQPDARGVRQRALRLDGRPGVALARGRAPPHRAGRGLRARHRRRGRRRAARRRRHRGGRRRAELHPGARDRRGAAGAPHPLLAGRDPRSLPVLLRPGPRAR